MNWIEVKIQTTCEALEAVSNILYEAGVTGVVIEDHMPITADSPTSWDYIDPTLEDEDFEGVTVIGYLPDDVTFSDKLLEIKNAIDLLVHFDIDAGLKEITISEVSEEDWSTSWKKYYKPVRVGKNIVVKPIWEEYEKQEGDLILELDPGMAFGTGTHETTVMCMEALEKYVKPHQTVIDVGTGSGILSITAALLGANPVVGIDLDPVAVRSAKENVHHNQLTDKIMILQGDLLSDEVPEADIVVSNIIASIIIKLIPDAIQTLKEDGIFICSGIIKEKLYSVQKVLLENDMVIVEVNERGEWVSIVSRKKGVKYDA